MRSFKQRNRAILIILGALAAAASAYALWPSEQQAEQIGLRSADPRAGALPISFAAPQFSFPDQDDAAFGTENFRGKVTIVDFIFTHCANTCPKMTAKRAELQKTIADPRVTFLSISVDPVGDDRATRKSYAAANRLDETRWRFVSPPDRDGALKIAQQMKIAAASPHSHEQSPILHSDRFVLIDASARVRGAYAITDQSAMSRLVRDANGLASEIPAVTK
jgi:protein SCO1/2